MVDDPRIDDLLEEILDSGATPEEVCRDCPELLSQIRAGWQRIRALQSEVDELFPDSDPPPGESGGKAAVGPPRVSGYDVGEELGRGGMGVVYKAWHRRLNRPVALKMLLAGPYAKPQELERFLREAEAVAGLRHPNIVQVHNAGEVDGRPFFTMELIEGGSLAQKIAGVPQSAREAAALVGTLADGIHAAHKSGIVHRDLKPANVLLTADGTPKVTDFGLARRFQESSGLTLTGAPMGTPSYMAPEQARGETGAIGPATDVYALGAILYECLTGRPPFRAETATATLQQVVADEPVPPARLNPQVPRDLATICLKCLEKDPARRYPSAAALADDLRRFDRGEPIAARPAGWLERAAKWARRRPATAVLLAAGVLMFAGVIAAAGWYVDHRARLQSETDSRAARVNRAANDSLDQAEVHLKDLRARLDDPLRVHELLSDIDRWQSLVEQARQASQRAASACVGNEELVADRTQTRIKAVQAKLSSEKAGYELARELDDILAEAHTPIDDLRSRLGRAAARYASFFSRLGVDIDRADKVHLESAITSSPIRFALVAGLDYWAVVTANVNPQNPHLARLLELARAADPDPWRDRFRHPAVWTDGAALAALAAEVDVERQSPTILTSLGTRLQLTGADSTALYKQAILCHPRDFWLQLKAAYYAKEPGTQVGLNLAACAIRPNSPMAYSNLSKSFREKGDLRGAVTAANRALALNPRFVAGHVNLGAALAASKDLPGAVAACKKAVELDPKSAAAYANLGVALRESKDLPGAVAAYKKATELDPKCTAAYVNLGVALRESKDLPGAVAAFKKVTQLDPKFTAAHNDLGHALRESKDLPGAVAAFKKAIELDPGRFQAHYGLGMTHQSQGHYAEAERAYLGAIQAQPAFDPAYNGLAWLLATCPDDKVRDGKRAVEYATTACKLTGWKEPGYLDTLAAAYAESGQFEEAVRYQTRALDDPTFAASFGPAAEQRLQLYLQRKPFRDQGP